MLLEEACALSPRPDIVVNPAVLDDEFGFVCAR
jgi:hypothetical protein